MPSASMRSNGHVRRNFEQGQQHEITLMHSRVRDGQLIGVECDVTIKQHVDIERACGIFFTIARPAVRLLDGRCLLMQCLWRERRTH